MVEKKSPLKQILPLFLTCPFLLAGSPIYAASSSSEDPQHIRHTSGTILTQTKKTKIKTKRKRSKQTGPSLEASPTTTPESNQILASEFIAGKTFRGLLGISMAGKMAIIFGGGATMPYSKKFILDGGFDYLKTGTTSYSVSMLRFGAGPSFFITSSPESVIRAGGRLGLAMISSTEVVPPEFEGEESGTASKSATALHGEARAAYERKMGGLIVGGEVQLPIFFSTAVSGTRGLTIYGSLGKSF